MAETLEDRPDQSEPAQVAARWIAELTLSEKGHERWRSAAKKIIKRYGADRETSDTARRFSMLWSYTQTITPALYSRPPQPVVGRRFKDSDPVGRVASEVLERALSYSIDRQDLDGVLTQCTGDLALIARAQTWERYVPTHGDEVVPQIKVLQLTNDAGVCYYEREDKQPVDPEAVKTGDDGEPYVDGEAYRPVVFEESVTDFLSYDDFGFGVARTWGEVPYVWRAAYLDRTALIERFGEKIGRAVPLDAAGGRNRTDAEKELTGKAKVYEIWDKATRRVYWISKGYGVSPLDMRDDPLGLDGFFPCPRPLFGTLPPDSLNPIPDFIYFADQADEIDMLTARIASLQSGLKVRGFYAASDSEDLNNLLNSANNTLIPVAGWQGLKEDGGIRGKIEWWPLEQVVSALKACIELRKQLIADVYEITGVSDLLRGSSDPRETATAQGIKANYGSLRIRERQNEVIRFARDVLRIKAEVIAEQFSSETLKAMTGVKLPMAADKEAANLQLQQMQMQAQAAAMQAQAAGQPPQPPPQPPQQLMELLQSPTWEDVEALLQNDALRSFRIDVESDSTIEPNEQEEKARTVEMITALGGFLAQAGPMVAQVPESAPMFAELIKFTVRRFRAGRELETVIDETMDKISAKAAQGAAAPGAEAAPPPDQTPVAVAQLNLQREEVHQQGENQRAQLAAQVQAGEQQLKQGDQQLKVVTMQRDPFPQVSA